MHQNPPIPSPVDSQRISHLDILRGFALLGILIMNISAFSMPASAYANPASFGNLEGLNLWVWALNHTFADSKFMTIFSMLFGAGICLFAENAEKKHGSATALHYQRNFYLMLFGLAHAYLLWFGDVLFTYAVCGFLVYWCRNLSVKWLLTLAFILVGFVSGYVWLIQMVIDIGEMPQEALDGMAKQWLPGEERQLREVTAYLGSLSEQYHERAKAAYLVQVEMLFSYSLWRVSGTMLVGMALYKTGVLSGERTTGFYVKMALLGCLSGLALSGYGAAQHIEHQFALEYSMLGGIQYNYWGSVFTALGYIGLVHLAIKANILVGLQQRLAAVGQMAFTNYIAQTLICTTIFYGHGFGQFGEIDRAPLMLIVLGVWVLQLWYSPIWLKTHRFGPLEWLWRTMTYRKRQPMAKVA